MALLTRAIEGRAWACTHRLLVDKDTDRAIGPDIWDLVGPDAGRFMAQGGFVDPTAC